MEFGENKILTIFVFAFLEQFKDPITSNSREKLIVSHPFIIFVLAKYFNVHYETDKKSQDYVYGKWENVGPYFSRSFGIEDGIIY